MTSSGRPGRRWRLRRPEAPDDDLLAGFDRAGRPRQLQVFFATTIATSLLVWDLAFTLGAYHTVFYSRLFQIVVASAVLFVGSVTLRKRVRVRPWMRIVLAIPLVWMANRGLAPLGRSSRAGKVLDDVLIGLIVVSVPFTLWALARVVAPDYFALRGRRIKIVSISIIVLVATAGFLVGRYNYVFTTCQNYVVAGDNEPANCRQAPPASP